MEFINYLIDVFLHLDVHLYSLVTEYRSWTYLLLFLVIFCETGLVVTPFLPGDSLLFASGAIAALGALNIWLLLIILIAAAFLGDSANYSIGKILGNKVYEKDYKFLKREHLDKTHKFFDKHGGKAIVIARFVPIVRTFAPFVAGVGSMSYTHFITYNLAGGVLWVGLCTVTGYFFGNIPWVKSNFSIVVILIILISLLPIFIEFVKHKMQKKAE
jgi:membrane-associated protein